MLKCPSTKVVVPSGKLLTKNLNSSRPMESRVRLVASGKVHYYEPLGPTILDLPHTLRLMSVTRLVSLGYSNASIQLLRRDQPSRLASPQMLKPIGP
jgi:hypothetical protein